MLVCQTLQMELKLFMVIYCSLQSKGKLVSCLSGSPGELALHLFSRQSSHWSPGRARWWNACIENATLEIREENSVQAQLGIPEREKEISKHNINNWGKRYDSASSGFSSLTGIVWNPLWCAMWWMKQGKVATEGTESTRKRKISQGNHRNVWFDSRKSLLWNSQGIKKSVSCA